MVRYEQSRSYFFPEDRPFMNIQLKFKNTLRFFHHEAKIFLSENPKSQKMGMGKKTGRTLRGHISVNFLHTDVKHLFLELSEADVSHRG